MSYTLKFDHPQFPPDSEFSINELGLFLNGQERDISEDEERLFVGVHGITVEDAFIGNAVVAVSGGASDLSEEDLATLIPPEVTPEEPATLPADTPTDPTTSDTSPDTPVDPAPPANAPDAPDAPATDPTLVINPEGVSDANAS